MLNMYINEVENAETYKKLNVTRYLSDIAHGTVKDLIPEELIGYKSKGDNKMDVNKNTEFKRSSDFTKKLYENLHKKDDDSKVENYKFTVNTSNPVSIDETENIINAKHSISTKPYFFSMGEAIVKLTDIGYIESTAETLVLNRRASLSRVSFMIDDIKDLIKKLIPDGNQDELDYNSDSKVCGKMTMKDINKQYNKLLITKFILTYTE